ncbi:penicillin acylase family protein [Ornithinimicrobium tianjinense]
MLGVGLARRSFPKTGGTLELAGLDGGVEVLRDALGVPHIYADTPEDLFRAQGFVSAQERFFQMDLRRHITAGRLSELVGEGGVATDRVIRTLGWRRVAEQELPLLSPTARSYLQAYSAGVNAYIEQQGSPSSMALEYVVLATSAPGYQVEPWDEVDSLAWLKAMAWDLRDNYDDELARGRLVGSVPLTQLNTLYPDYPYEEHPPIVGVDEWSPPANGETAPGDGRGGTSGPVDGEPGGPSDPADAARLGPPGPPAPPAGSPTQSWMAAPAVDDALAGAQAALAAVPELVGRGEGIGSNSWVVSGEHTASGKPILANDPHLSGSQPGVFMQTGLHCRQLSQDCPFDVSGFSFAGFPGIIIGHNTQIAWGFTNMAPDVTDFYLEDVRQDRVMREGQYVPMEVRTETIKVAGGDDVQLTVRETVHGPIVSDVLPEVADLGTDAPQGGVQTSQDFAVSLAWTALEPHPTAEAVFAMNAATGWEDFRDAARLFAVPAQNLVYADTSGTIGYQAPGVVPVRRSATHGTPPGFYPAPGWDPAYDWTGYVDFEDLPHTVDPPDGIIVAANQAVLRGNRPFLTTENDKGYRSARIGELLQEHLAQGPLTVETMQQIQLDDHNSFAETLLPYLLDAQLEGEFYTEPRDLLRAWDLTNPAEGEQAAAAAYYNAIYDRLLGMVFDDELPPGLGATGNARSMLLVSQLLDDPDNPWWDNKGTPGVVETRDVVIRTAMIDARHDLTSRLGKDPRGWEWGELHTVALEHSVLSGDEVPGVVRSIFSQKPAPVSGSTAMVNAMNWDATTADYTVVTAPAFRMVVDLADLDASTWVNQTGVSGHPFHPAWDDQTAAWVAGETYPWPSSREAVLEAAEDTLTLTPASSTP